MASSDIIRVTLAGKTPRAAHVYSLSKDIFANYDCYSDYELIVVYTKETEEHDGYCSDPYDEETNVEIITYSYPLLKHFKKTDFNDDNSIDNDNGKLNSFYRKDREACYRGSGYCGMGTTYNILKAYIINNTYTDSKDIINGLDD